MQKENPQPPQNVKEENPPVKKRRRMSRWISVPLRLIGILLLIVVLIPVALYIPAVQTFLTRTACSIVKDKTGMDVEIESFRLRFPLDISLEGVSVVEASGDTMVMARSAVADVRLLPLLKLDLQVKRLTLNDGYYRMVSPDSSMIMKIRAGLVEVDPPASVNIAASKILLDHAKIADGDVALYMNVWKQKSTPQDTTSTPFYIAAKALDVERIRFGMSMLPTIDTLALDVNALKLRDAVIDLRTNNITARSLRINGGNARYLAPTPEYVAAHPAPAPDTTAVASAPMTIKADTIAISGFGATYALAGARPQPGLDPNYIQVSNVAIELLNFYNRQSALRLPISRLEAKERSGLQIVEGSGLIALDESGLTLDGVAIRTPYSRISATAGLPFALMALQPSAPVDASVEASLGMADVAALLPMASPYLKKLPGAPINAKVKATGTLAAVDVSAFDLAMPGYFSMRASGSARNALDYKNLVANLTLDGEVTNPSPISSFVENMPVEIPPLKLKGTLGANHSDYSADISLITPVGSLLADARLGLNSENYFADVEVNNLDVAHFMPAAGVGTVSATLRAEGSGFNPTQPRAHTDLSAKISSITYNGYNLRDITLRGHLAESNFMFDLDSPNTDLNLTANITGSLHPDDYCAEGLIRLYNADLKAFGLSETTNEGSADLQFDLRARPEQWLYDANLNFSSIAWDLNDADINIPDGLTLNFISETDNVHAAIDARGTQFTFDSQSGLQRVVEGFTKAMQAATRQVDARSLDVEELQGMLPDFRVRGRISGGGLLNDFLHPSGMGLDTLAVTLTNDSLLNANLYAGRLTTSGMTLDTITLNVTERGKLFDYMIHMGNRPGSLDEFARVNINGYVGDNRFSAFLNQHNLAGKMGYRFGFTGAIADSTISVHFTPLKSTIAYMPWTFNDDNHVDYCLTNRRINANLEASSSESSILLKTEPSVLGGDDLHLNLTNIHVQDFLNMSLFAPPVKADVDADLRVHYDGTVLTGKGDVGISNLIYDKMAVGNFDLGLKAGVNFAGKSEIAASLKVDDADALTLSTVLEQQEGKLEPSIINVDLDEFPLKVANAFLGKDVATLSGALDGHMEMTGSLTQPVLNGSITPHKAGVYLPIMGSSLTLDSVALTVDNSVLNFNHFNIYGSNANPLTLNGSVDARRFDAMSFDLTAAAQQFQLVNSDKRSKSDLYGKLFLTLSASVKGPMSHFDINGNVDVLSNTDITYNVLLGANTQVSAIGGDGGVVKFVNFSDTTQTAATDTVGKMMAMRVTAGLTITPGAQVAVNIDGTASGVGSGKVALAPSGTLNYFQNFMGDMSLNGQLFLGNGSARYKIPVMGEKTFTFDPQSYVLFNGDIMNPTLNIQATDQVKATVVNSGGNSSQVNFLVGLDVSGTLSAPKVVFDLSTNDDLSLENELQSMSADQRSTQAMNLLITGRYQGNGIKTSNSGMAENMLYGFLTSTLNNWAANNIRGVDLSFGIDQYDNTTNGQTSSAMSYSYQVSKSLFSNRFKIVVGGNYSTDASADENFAENLISDVSFEYTLKQTNTLTMLVRLFRHAGYESILEGEVTEMGVGFTMRRRLSDLSRLFKMRWGKAKKPTPPAEPAPADSLATRPEESINDSTKKD